MSMVFLDNLISSLIPDGGKYIVIGGESRPIFDFERRAVLRKIGSAESHINVLDSEIFSIIIVWDKSEFSIETDAVIKGAISKHTSILFRSGIEATDFLDLSLFEGYRFYSIDNEKRQLEFIDQKKSFLDKGVLLAVHPNRNPVVYFLSHSSEKGGAEWSLLGLIDDLIAEQCGFILHVSCPKEGALSNELRFRPVSLSFVDIAWWGHLSAFSILDSRKKILKSAYEILEDMLLVRPDIAYTNTITIPGAAMVAKVIGIPHIWHVHEFGDIDHGIQFVNTKKERAKYVFSRSEKVIFNSVALEKYYRPKYNQSKAVVAYYHIPWDNLVGETRSEFDGDTFSFLLAGQIQPGKCQFHAVQAAALLHKRGVTGFQLKLLGRTNSISYRKEIEKYVKISGIGDIVKICDFASDPRKEFFTSNAVLMCSKSEAFGRVTVEAMLSGKPVIGANSGATPELIKDGVTGLIFCWGDILDLSEKMSILLSERDRSQEMGAAAKLDALARFTQEGYGGRIALVIRECLHLDDSSRFIHQTYELVSLNRMLRNEVSSVVGHGRVLDYLVMMLSSLKRFLGVCRKK